MIVAVCVTVTVSVVSVAVKVAEPRVADFTVNPTFPLKFEVPVAIEMSLSFDRAPSRSTPTTRLHKSNPKGRRLRQTYSSGVLLVTRGAH